MSTPALLIAGLRGGNGKTLLAVGLAAAFRRRGRKVAPFKKGPDYIDAAWLTAATDRPCRNLDLFLMSEQTILDSYARGSAAADFAVIEGNRGLYDGSDAGSFSSAELAKMLGVPVVLVVDVTKSTRTVAAMVLGCQRLDPQVPIAGVILNRVAGRRHESVLREAITSICGLPVVGAVPRLAAERLFPERHLGLVPPPEHDAVGASVEQALSVAEEFLDLDALLEIARQAAPPDLPAEAKDRGQAVPAASALPEPAVRVGVFRDAAFQFYYPENLEALCRASARIVEISPIREAELPEVDALYIGGGFPETLAPQLAANAGFRQALRRRAEGGLPIYAECGGVVYLADSIVYQDQTYPMAGVLPAVFGFGAKPQGHGYAELETVTENPFYAVGDCLRGHEFHYTYLKGFLASASHPAASTDTGTAREADDEPGLPACTSTMPAELRYAFRVRRGFGFSGEHDGLVWRNVLALYTHVHALGTPEWASAMIRNAVRHRARSATAKR